MSERQQRTANSMRDKMLHRYASEDQLVQVDKHHRIIPHRHDKNHLEYRRHSKTYPCQNEEFEVIDGNVGIHRVHNLKRVKMRQRGGRVH